MSSQLGFALVGCGDIGELNAWSIAEAQRVRLVRVVDVDADTARAMAQHFGVPSSSSLERALEEPAVQAVFIATPHDLHVPMVIAAARAGRHVIVEKPLATTVESAEEAIAECRKAGVNLSVCHPRRYEAKVGFARGLVEQGLTGRLLLSTTRFLKEKEAEYWTPWRKSRSRSGGGVLLMNLVHHIDALQVVTGCRITSVFGLYDSLDTDAEVEDTVAMSLRYKTGAIGSLVACSALPGPKVFEDIVYGTEGRVVLAKKSVQLFSRRPSDHAPAGEWAEFPFEEDRVSKVRFVEEFAASVHEGRQPPVPASYGLEILSLVERAYEMQRRT